MSGKLSLNKFKQFYEENKDIIKMPDGNNYPLNYKKATRWANMQCDIESRNFAQQIIKYTQYVPFSVFYSKLLSICQSYVADSIKEKESGEAVFILIIPFRVSKSNIWVSLLAYEFLHSIIDEVYYDITEVYNNTLNHRSNLYRKKIHCIICDDCAYTGHQLSYISSFDNSWINYPNKPVPPNIYSKKWLEWYEKVDVSSNTYIQTIDINNFSVDVIIPYMSILAQKRLHDIHYVRVPRTCRVFSIFSQQVDMEMIPIHILNEFKRTFQYHKDISAIYFDHKIADAVSTFHKIYLLAPVFNCSVSNNRVGFIENCDDDKIPDSVNIYDYHVDLEKAGHKTCPLSFYKNLKYTFNGKSVDPSVYVFDLFKEKNIRIKKESK
jgi:hypothetical protein